MAPECCAFKSFALHIFNAAYAANSTEVKQSIGTNMQTHTPAINTASLPFGVNAFEPRNMKGWYEHPAFDVVYVDPLTWHCYYIEDSFVSTMEEAQDLANSYNGGQPVPQGQLISMEDDQH